MLEVLIAELNRKSQNVGCFIISLAHSNVTSFSVLSRDRVTLDYATQGRHSFAVFLALFVKEEHFWHAEKLLHVLFLESDCLVRVSHLLVRVQEKRI